MTESPSREEWLPEGQDPRMEVHNPTDGVYAATGDYIHALEVGPSRLTGRRGSWASPRGGGDPTG